MESKQSDSAKGADPLAQDWWEEVERLVAFPFPCPNCDQPMTEPSLFCADLCKQEAKFVRYARACTADGRRWEPDVEEALKIRMAHILGGGYPEHLRLLSDHIREEVIARDQGRCVKCGAAGTDVDHIHGSSNDLANLQLLCRTCHNQKTVEGFQPISPDTHPEEWAKAMSLMARVEVDRPVRVCDSKEWEYLWRRIRRVRKQVVACRR